MKKVLFIVCLLEVFLLPSCIPSKPTDEVEILPSERLINKLEINRRRIKNFEGTGIMRVKSEQFNNSAASFRVVLQKPDSIYLTVMGPFGIELGQALVTKRNFVFYDALSNTAYEGAASNEVLREIFKIELSFEDLMDAFIGSVNLTEKLYRTPDKYVVDYDQYVLTYIDSLTNVKTEYRVDVRELGITNYKLLNNSGEAVLEGTYSEFGLIEEVAVPYKIEVQNKKQNQKVSIEYRNMTANQNDIYIDFRVPEDANLIEW